MVKGTPASSAANIPSQPSYAVAEAWSAGLCAAYLLMAVGGRWWNRRLLLRWKQAVQERVEGECALVGEDAVDEAQRAADGGAEFGGVASGDGWKEVDANGCELYVTGRRNMLGMLVRFNLRMRHDVFSTLRSWLLESDSDQVRVKVFLPPTMERMVFAVGKQAELKALHTAYQELERYTEEVTAVVDGLHEAYGVLADTKEVASALLGGREKQFLNQYEAYICRIRISDVCEKHLQTEEGQQDDDDGGREDDDPDMPESEPVTDGTAAVGDTAAAAAARPESCTRMFQLIATLPADPQVLRDMLAFCFHMVDRIGALRLSAASRQTVTTLRAQVAETERKRRNEKLAAHARRRAEERRSRLTDEQRRRLELRGLRKRAKASKPPQKFYL
ncbi:hypothetical protein CDCA_CDCA09G2741 [Cyanidium caldarium]|uniref:Coiled-coil domain-containing protein 47 n=1 Tax=Cyanidium caldarium TaxID=2771 RepID=A0AAV9IX68_CYACA|nr:hypothetical protein CDCA_CDCA09G2741 [Cyanidium caldarium]